jgi:hypothetical protein
MRRRNQPCRFEVHDKHGSHYLLLLGKRCSMDEFRVRSKFVNNFKKRLVCDFHVIRGRIRARMNGLLGRGQLSMARGAMPGASMSTRLSFFGVDEPSQ